MDLDALVRVAHAGDLDSRNALGLWVCAELSRYFAERRFNASEIEELVQRALVDILKKFAEAPTDGDAFTNWALGFAWTEVRAMKGEERRQRARAAKLAAAPAHDSPPTPPNEPLLEKEQRHLVSHHMRDLPPIYRRALQHYIDGGDYRSLARQEQVLEPTARWRVHEATRRLMKMIEIARVTRSPYRTPPVAV